MHVPELNLARHSVELDSSMESHLWLAIHELEHSLARSDGLHKVGIQCRDAAEREGHREGVHQERCQLTRRQLVVQHEYRSIPEHEAERNLCRPSA